MVSSSSFDRLKRATGDDFATKVDGKESIRVDSEHVFMFGSERAMRTHLTHFPFDDYVRSDARISIGKDDVLVNVGESYVLKAYFDTATKALGHGTIVLGLKRGNAPVLLANEGNIVMVSNRNLTDEEIGSLRTVDSETYKMITSATREMDKDSLIALLGIGKRNVTKTFIVNEIIRRGLAGEYLSKCKKNGIKNLETCERR